MVQARQAATGVLTLTLGVLATLYDGTWARVLLWTGAGGAALFLVLDLVIARWKRTTPVAPQPIPPPLPDSSKEVRWSPLVWPPRSRGGIKDVMAEGERTRETAQRLTSEKPPPVERGPANQPSPASSQELQELQEQANPAQESRVTVPATVSEPPPLLPGYPERARVELIRALSVFETQAAELQRDVFETAEQQADTRRKRKEWAERVRKTLDNAAMSDHGDYFFVTKPSVVRSSGWGDIARHAALGGAEEMKSGWRLDERLTKLRRIAAQLREERRDTP